MCRLGNSVSEVSNPRLRVDAIGEILPQQQDVLLHTFASERQPQVQVERRAIGPIKEELSVIAAPRLAGLRVTLLDHIGSVPRENVIRGSADLLIPRDIEQAFRSLVNQYILAVRCALDAQHKRKIVNDRLSNSRVAPLWSTRRITESTKNVTPAAPAGKQKSDRHGVEILFRSADA